METTQINHQSLAYGDMIIEELAAQHAELVKQTAFFKIDNELLVKENIRLQELCQENQENVE